MDVSLRQGRKPWLACDFLCNENPRFERGFRKLKAMSPFVKLHGRIVEGLPTATKEKENTNGQEYFSTYHMGM